MRKRSFAKVVGRATLALLVTLALPVARARAADVPISDEARTHFAAGVALLQDPKAPRYEDAYREFKAAYAASPSYKILGNLGLCAMKIERDAEAIEAYETYLKEARSELSPAERDQAERDLLTLKTGVVRVTVSSDPPGASIVDVRTPIEGNDVRNVYGPATAPLALGLRRGHHVVTARLAGYPDEHWEFEASGTTLPPHVFKLVKPVVPVAVAGPEFRPTRPVPAAAWVSGLVTLSLGVGSGVVGALAIHTRDKYQSENDGFHVSQAQTDRTDGQTYNTIADGLLGGAVVGALLTSYFVVSRPTVNQPVNSARLVSIVPRLAPVPAAGGVGVVAAWSY
jgi:hypothetical protein